MSKSATSVFVFAMYLFAVGVVFVVVPNLLLRVLGMAETDEVWIRVVGMLVLILGYYYSQSARMGLSQFFRLTVVARTAVLLFFIGLVLAGLAPPVLILFGVIDFLAAMWTALALRSEASA
jgi:hypothetical protein